MVLHRRARGLLLRLLGSDAPGVSLAVALLAFVVLPALHVLQHEREARRAAIAHRLHHPQASLAPPGGIPATLHAEQTLLHEHEHEHEHAAPHEHQPAPGSRKPERSQHGKGSIEHFSVALLESITPSLPGPSGTLACLPILVRQSRCPVPPPSRPNTIRGPPAFS